MPAQPGRTAAVPPVKPDAKKAKEAYQQGIRAELKEDWQEAFTSYSDATNLAPENHNYLLRREMARSRLVQAKMNAAERDADIGRLDQARQELLTARYLDPTNAVVRERFAELSAFDAGQIKMKPEPDIAGEVHLDYQPGVARFDYRGDTEGAYEQLASRFGVEVAFDVDLRSSSVRFQVDGVDFPTAARLLGEMTGTFWRPLTKRLFFVTDDTPQKRKDYDLSIVRTILLPASETPDQMTETLRLVREIAGITRSELDPNSRTLTLRASPQAIAVASDLVNQVEQPVGGLVLEIEILNVDRNFARQLGITPPQTSQVVPLTSTEVQEAEQSLQGLVDVITQVFGTPSSLSGLSASQISSLLGSGQIGLGSILPPVVAFGGGDTTFLATMPGAAANFSTMLTLVQQGQRILLRAQDGRPATFFIGQRYPVSLAQFSSSFAGTGSNTPGVSATNFPTTNYPVGNTPSFVVTGSLRNNSINDLVAANSADNTISVLLGDGTGAFGTQTTFPAGTDPVWIATGQFNSSATAANNDSFLDLAVVNKGSNTVSIFLGNGDGTFKPKVDMPTGSIPVSAVTADFHDLTSSSEVDLAVANQGDNTISIYQGNGDGTFQKPTLVQLPANFSPTALAAADFNGDGHTDLAVTSSGTNAVWILLGNGNGTFSTGPSLQYSTGTDPVWISIADFNDDGFLDLAIANSESNTVSIFLGNGNGTFTAATNPQVPAGTAPTSIAVGDYNVDGLPDLAVADKSDNAVSLLLNLGSGLFGPNYELPVGTAPVSITSADFNSDNLPDVAVANSGSANVTVILDSSSFSGATNGLEATPFPGVEYLDVGLKVKATPRIHSNEDVSLQLSVEESSLSSQSFNTIPVINNDSVDQTVRLKANQTTILAGFMQSQVIKAINGTPGIADIPGLGYAASNQGVQNQSQEVLLLITPRLVRLAPRKDRTIYAGQGSLEGGGAVTSAAGFGPMRELPESAAPATRQQPPPGQAGPPSAVGAPPNQQPGGVSTRTFPPGESGQAGQAAPQQPPEQ
jgi:Bacterial type II and III secretion system protein/FG-GAP-like repeat